MRDVPHTDVRCPGILDPTPASNVDGLFLAVQERCPVVSKCEGQRRGFKAANAILDAPGVTIVDDDDAYVAAALSYATDPKLGAGPHTGALMCLAPLSL